MLYLHTWEGDVIRDIAQGSGVAGDVAEMCVVPSYVSIEDCFYTWKM